MGVGTIVVIGLLVGALRVRVDELPQTVRSGERLFLSSFENAPIGKALVHSYELDKRYIRADGQVVWGRDARVARPR